MVPGPGGPLREWAAVYISMKDLAIKEEVSKQKINERETRNYTGSEAGRWASAEVTYRKKLN
jgi:hypothetical protein